MADERRRAVLRFVATTPAALALALPIGAVPASPLQAQTDAASEGVFRLVVDDGFGNPNNTGVDRVYAAQGYLFAGAHNETEGMIVYRSRDGEHFEQISEPGVDGDLKNNYPVAFGWFKGHLYVASWDGTQAFSGSPGGSVWRGNADAEDPADIVWETITTDSFGDPTNQALVGFEEFKGYLYAGTFNYDGDLATGGTNGAEIMRSATGDADDWTTVAPKGFGDPDCTTDAHKTVVHDGYLYYSTEKFACLGRSGTEIWRTDGDLSPPYDQWELMNVPGFGRPYNNNVIAMDVLDDHLFAATWGYGVGSEVWRLDLNETSDLPFDNFELWEQVSLTGFGDPANAWSNELVELDGTIYVAGMDPFGPSRGFFYKSSEPLGSAVETMTTWEEITAEGWPPTDGSAGSGFSAAGPYDLEVFDGKVYMAYHTQTFPGQLWVYEPASDDPPTQPDDDEGTTNEPDDDTAAESDDDETARAPAPRATANLPATGGGPGPLLALPLLAGAFAARRVYRRGITRER